MAVVKSEPTVLESSLEKLHLKKDDGPIWNIDKNCTLSVTGNINFKLLPDVCSIVCILRAAKGSTGKNSRFFFLKILAKKSILTKKFNFHEKIQF